MMEMDKCFQFDKEREMKKEKAVKDILKILDGFTMGEAKNILSMTEYTLPAIAKINADSAK